VLKLGRSAAKKAIAIGSLDPFARLRRAVGIRAATRYVL
jgi:hypothetical protein